MAESTNIDDSDGGGVTSGCSSMLTENMSAIDSGCWNFIAVLDIPGSDRFDHGDVTRALHKAGYKDVLGVKLSQCSNQMTDGVHSTYATASVTTQNADNTSPSEVEIWSGFNSPQPLTLFSEECAAVFNISPRLLSPQLLTCLLQQASLFQLIVKRNPATESRLEVFGNCSQVHKFREYFAALCIKQVLHNTDLKPSVDDTTALLNVTDPLADNTASSSNNIFANLSPDVLLLMPKLKTIRGILYFPQEGRIEVTATDSEERNKVISNFQESYQNIVSNRQLKTGTLELPATCKPQQISEIIDQFNDKYHQCYFSYNEISHSVKIISLSSRQFEQAKMLLKEGAGISSSNSPPHDTDGVRVLVLSNQRVVTVKRGDMILEEADIIVNAANSDLKHWGGLAQALNKASNGELQKHSAVYTKKYGKVVVGEVCTTSAGGRLRCKQVIHAVGPIASECKNESSCQQLIFNAITNTLKKAHSLKAVSIVLPALSTGVYAVNPQLSAQAMFNAIISFKYKNKDVLKDIRIVILDEPTYQCFAAEVTSWRSSHGVNPGIPKLERSLSDSDKGSSSGGIVTTQPSTTGNDHLSSISYPNMTSSHATSMVTATGHSGTTVGHPPGIPTPSAWSGTSPLFKPSTLQPNKLDPFPMNKGSGNKPDSHSTVACPICRNSTATDPVSTYCCKQTYCRACLDSALQHSPYCPTCTVPLRPVRGNQPQGSTMVTNTSTHPLPGYLQCGRIKIDYFIPSGHQGPEHPNPGQWYSGTSRTGYLPDNEEGNRVLRLLKRAFDAGLIFTIGTSVTSGMTNTVTWNDIHHKTNIHGGPTGYGYPDPTYLKRVQDELKAKGIY